MILVFFKVTVYTIIIIYIITTEYREVIYEKRNFCSWSCHTI